MTPHTTPLDRRYVGIALAVGIVALVISHVAPLWALALGPLTLGVPHLLADLRYVVVRQGLQRQRLWLLLAVLAIGAAAVGLGVRATLTVVPLVALLCPGDWSRRLGIALGAAALASLAWRAGSTADVVMGHAHNFIAIALWIIWKKRAGFAHWLVLAAWLAGAIALILVPLPPAALVAPAHGLAVNDLARSLAPHLDPLWATRWVVLYAYFQLLHYGIWLHLIPTDDGAPLTFPALRRDLGLPLLVGTALVALGLAVWGILDLVAARTHYFQVAYFHGHLELLAAPFLMLRGVRLFVGDARDP